MNFGDKPTTTTGSSMGSYPSWMREDMLEAQDAYKRLYESNLERGYRPYTGMTTAGFTPEQIASQQGLASLVGSQAPIQQEALGLTRGLSSDFTPDQAQKYMSPYLRASLDAQKAAAQRQFEGTKLPQLEADAVAAGGMSGRGSRAGVQFAEAQAGQNRLLADLEATGQQKAYEDAQNLFKSQKERERQTALALQNLNKQIFSGGLKEQALLDAIGTEKQQMAQQMLDEAQTKYYDREEFARNELNKWYQSLLGNPIWKQPNYQTTGSQGGGGPGMGKTLLSLAGIGLGLGGVKIPTFKGGGSIRGGLASTSQARPYMNYMRRNMGGKVMPPVVYRQTGGGGLPAYSVTGDKLYTAENAPLFIEGSGDEGVPIPQVDILEAEKIAQSQKLAAEREAQSQKLVAEREAQSEKLAADRAMVGLYSMSPLKPITSLYDVEKIVLGSSAQIAKDKIAEATANRAANEKEIKGIRRETEAFQKTQQKRFNKYQDMVKKLVGEDPNANRKFWFTVAAAIAQPGGNAATNFVKGMHKATLDADADRKEKNKIFMTLSKDEMEFMKDVDKLGFKSEIKLLGLTKAQEKELAGLDSSIRKAIIAELKAGAEYNTAKAKLLKEQRGKRTYKPSETRQTWKAIAQGKGYFEIGPDGNVISVDTSIFGDNANEVKIKANAILPEAQKRGEESGSQTVASEYITNAFAKLLREGAGGSGDSEFPTTKTSISLDAIKALRKDPSAAAKREFDEAFGSGSADYVLGDQASF